MQKRIISESSEEVLTPTHDWLDVEHLAQVEITSESEDYPIESALVPGTASGWRAAETGEQIIRLLFDEPVSLRRIHLVFEELENGRTQEFVVGWSTRVGEPLREVVRQQYTFSPPHTTLEVEDYRVQLDDVKVLQLTIIPAISGGASCASLKELRLASLITK